MIVINLDKARAIANTRAEAIQDATQRAAVMEAIGRATDLVQLRAILDGLTK